MDMKRALEIAEDYSNTRGYQLGFRYDDDGRLRLSDGVVQVDVTDFSEAELRAEIEAWLASADDSALE